MYLTPAITRRKRNRIFVIKSKTVSVSFCANSAATKCGSVNKVHSTFFSSCIYSNLQKNVNKLIKTFNKDTSLP